jgi:hypothetical protein
MGETMTLRNRTCTACVAVLGLLVAACSGTRTEQQAQPRQAAWQSPQLPAEPVLEPAAVELLKAMSARLAAARAMSFTALTTYESPARTGQPLAYTTLSRVTLQRPDKLRVITPGDGPPSEFYYDGKVMMAYSPDTSLVAIADAPSTVDAMLKAAYDRAALYFPFTDVIVADPYRALADGLKLAFIVGQSRVIGGTRTDMVAIANDILQAELWIGANDHLPRMIRATFFDEPGNYRHVVEFSDWRLNPAIAPGTFTSARAAGARRIEFARPDAAGPPQQPGQP